MPRDWERDFTAWSRGPDAAEQQRCENAENQVREAIAASPKLRDRSIRVFTQGSYRNRVNVRRDSDVDIGVVCFDSYFEHAPDDNVRKALAESTQPATYVYSAFKADLEEALVARFGRSAVTRGSKAFDVKATSYRVEADVAPFFEHRRYTSVSSYVSGVELIPDSGMPPRVRNWPEQHYESGVEKNDACSRRFKRVVRVVKSLRNEMAARAVQSATVTPSFLIECLVFNTPNYALQLDSYYSTVRATLAHLITNTVRDDLCSEWGEVSELKYLFRPSQPWSRASAHAFLSDAWRYVGYI